MAKRPSQGSTETGEAATAAPQQAGFELATSGTTTESAAATDAIEAAVRAFIEGPRGQTLLRSVSATVAGPIADVARVVSQVTSAAGAAFSTGRLNTQLQAVATSPVALKTMLIDVMSSMDPRLQLAVLNRRSGKVSLPTASTGEDEIAVIARVASPEDWEAIADVTPGSTVGQTPEKDWIVTGRIPLGRVEQVRVEPTVRSLKASQPLHPELAETLKSMKVAPTALSSTVKPAGGKGVVIGIVDFGCDIAHENFRLASGKSRILALWDQGGSAQAGSPMGYGRLHSRTQINSALAASDPYAKLGYPRAVDQGWQKGTHGTHVMDIAAGNGRGSKQAGVAPSADIVFVEAAASDIAWTGPTSVNQAFGDSVQMLEAVRFIFDTAGDRPCVINLSLGTNGGPHDGTSLVEQGLDALVNEKPNRAVVIAASNSQNDGIHKSGEIPRTGQHDIAWQHDSESGGEFELWYAGEHRLEVTLIAPDGTPFGPLVPGNNLAIGAGSTPAIFISSRLNDPNNHDNVIGVWIAPGVSAGNWTVRLKSIDGVATPYHAWIERNDAAQTHFADPVNTHTLGSISTGHHSIVVASYDGHKTGMPLSTFSSCGPTRDNRQKPEVSAPGHNVVAARSLTSNGVVRKSGTSMAAPAVTGLIGLMLAEAKRKGKQLSTADIRANLMKGVLKAPPAGAAAAWHDRYGFGRASGKAI